MFWIGGLSFVNADMIVSVSDYSLEENKRKIKSAKTKNLVTDYSNGKKKESIICLTNGEIYISPIPVIDLINAENERKKKNA